MPATLYLVATPIGNLEDITLRALRVLREEVSTIACEDTRHTIKLLNHFSIVRPLVSYHEHNEESRTQELLSIIERGESIALVSDAGTPLISDPGYRLVKAAIDRGCPVVALPGPSALLVALTGSGLPTDRFRFGGFLPPKEGARREVLMALRSEAVTIVLYESPHRILDTLEDIATLLGERPIALARELTKLHEEFIRGTARSIKNQLEQRASIKGEITLVIGQGDESDAQGNPREDVERLQRDLGLERMEAIKMVAKNRGMAKRDLYRLVTDMSR